MSSDFERQAAGMLRQFPTTRLPKRILSFDIETRGGLTNFEEIEILVGGIIEYERSSRHKWISGVYEYYTAAKIEKLKSR